MFLHIMWLALTYVVGSFPFGLLLAKVCCGLDPRFAGSGNTGATNVARLCGLRVGVAALACDMLKGLLPVLAARGFSDNALFLSLVALFAILGHMYSCFLEGHGGKGVATTIGAFAGLMFTPTLLAVIGCLGAIALTGYVSVGSLTLAALLPILALPMATAYTPAALFATLIVFWKHRGNIQRLISGEENSWKKR